MVGAKQFAIMRKIIKEKTERPQAKEIHLPTDISGDKALNGISGTFMDKINGRLRAASPPPPEHHNHIMDVLDGLMMPDFMKSSFIIEKPIEKPSKTKSKKDEISEETLNKITHQVFQNIREYLDEDREREEQKKKVKIEICM